MGYNEYKTPAATQARIASLTAIEPELTLGDVLAVANGQKRPDDHAKATEVHNLLPGKANHSLSKLKTQEKGMHDRNRRTLSGVATKYGDNNSQITNWPAAPATASGKSHRPGPKSQPYNAKIFSL